MKLLQLLLVLSLNLTFADFSPSFNKFLDEKYGNISSLRRLDLGPNGSFGGGDHTVGEKTKHSPVVFVHGYRYYAGAFNNLLPKFKSQNYSNAELYGTSYGYKSDDPKYVTNLKGILCEYVKSQRQLIQAVHEFTSQPVNVIGVSMGAAVSRKTLLGGICVDTKEDLGEPLTPIIRNFVSVCGVNQGAAVCNNSTYAKNFMCNKNNGVKCGSDFINNINSKTRYEGQKAFAIESKDDDIVGFYVCGKKAMEFEGAQNFTFSGYGHIATYQNTFDLQFELVNKD